MRIHLIAIGGAVMHNLALALKEKGYTVTGSDDEIFEPSKSRLAAQGLLPAEQGWFPEIITTGIDAVILGMHARADNPELLRAQSLGIPVYNFPEYIFEQSKEKTRVAVCGSHGKTSITSMIMHCLRQQVKHFDYLVGAQLQGFNTMVQLSDADTIVIEGDEYFASPLDRRPKFLFYKPHITLLSGIAWDHFNVFPTWPEYLRQFTQLLNSLSPEGKLIYFNDDANIREAIQNSACSAKLIPYGTPAYTIINGLTSIEYEGAIYHFNIFGRHNMQNMEGARLVCEELGLSSIDFYSAMQNFKGAAKRLEKMFASEEKIIFRDFAHAPSKVKATVDAVKEQFPQRKLVACLELHTFSSLNKDFLPQYENSMQAADIRLVYFNPHTLELKKLPPLSEDDVKHYFNDPELVVLGNSDDLKTQLKNYNLPGTDILLMSSGNFNNLDFAFLT